MKQSHFILLSLLLLATASCKKEEEEEGPFYKLKPEDLAPPASTTQLTAAEISEYFVFSSSDFLANDGTTDDDNSVAESDCLLSTLYSVPVSASGDTLTLDVALNFSKCIEESFSEIFPGAKTNVNKATVGFYIALTCTGQDLSSLNGKTLGDIPSTPCEGDEKSLSNSKTEVDISISIEGQVRTMANVNYNVVGTLTNEPCATSSSGEEKSTSNDCVFISKTIPIGFEEDSEYIKIAHRDLKWTDSGEKSWFTSGAMDLTFNNWTGSVEFHGPLENPTYSMTDGTETVASFVPFPAAGLSIAGSAYRSASLAMKSIVDQSKKAPE